MRGRAARRRSGAAARGRGRSTVWGVPVPPGRLAPVVLGVTAFELANVAATLLILRTTELIAPGHDYSRTAVLLYAGYNLAATLIAVPAGQLTDRRGATI